MGVYFTHADIHCHYLHTLLALFWLSWPLFLPNKEYLYLSFQTTQNTETGLCHKVQSYRHKRKRDVTECYQNNTSCFWGSTWIEKINFSHAAEMTGATCWATELCPQTAAISEADLIKNMLIKFYFLFCVKLKNIKFEDQKHKLQSL